MIKGLLTWKQGEMMNDTNTDSRDRLMKRVMQAKEERKDFQQELLQRHSLPVISLTLNLPGGYEEYPQFEEVFHSALRVLSETFAGYMAEHHHRMGKWGPEGFWAVNLPAVRVKEKTMDIEEIHPLGRIFDIDVINEEGRGLSRRDFSREGRRCLVCEDPAIECYRGRRHEPGEVKDQVEEIIRKGLIRDEQE